MAQPPALAVIIGFPDEVPDPRNFSGDADFLSGRPGKRYVADVASAAGVFSCETAADSPAV
jgi:hypothetical protein